VPAGVAAVAVEPASTGDVTVFAISLAVTRLVLAVANGQAGGRTQLLQLRITRALLTSAALFLVSAWVPEPFTYVLWVIGIGLESGAMLNEDREATRRARDKHDWSELAPADPAEALDAHHFAERFGLFLIILLGEVMVEAGQSGAALHVDTAGGWTALVAAMVLAGALWWLYFDSVADVNLRVLELSGGSPTMARAIFAVGHMLPAFALLITASGVGLLLEDDPPRIAYGFACTGVALYMLGTRVIRMGSGRVPAPVRVLLVVATFALAPLFHGLDGSAYLWLLTAWVLMVAALTTRTDKSDDDALARFLPPDRPERERRAAAD
jgi:low temperature requirement protein LtrA